MLSTADADSASLTFCRSQAVGVRPAAVRVAEFESYALSVQVSEDLGRQHHDDVDEPLIVLEGALEVEVYGQVLRLGSGQLLVIPRGEVQHPRPVGEALEPEHLPCS
jgi:mannose-6-phosphate isomerase-like protein (cupin superfamily)